MNHQLATVLVMDVTYGKDATMTRLIRRVTRENIWLQIAIVLAFGMMLGHFFLCPGPPTD
jgi:hypothetical protein